MNGLFSRSKLYMLNSCKCGLLFGWYDELGENNNKNVESGMVNAISDKILVNFSRITGNISPETT